MQQYQNVIDQLDLILKDKIYEKDLNKVKKTFKSAFKYIEKRFKTYKRFKEVLTTSLFIDLAYLSFLKNLFEIELFEEFNKKKSLIRYNFILEKIDENYINKLKKNSFRKLFETVPTSLKKLIEKKDKRYQTYIENIYLSLEFFNRFKIEEIINYLFRIQGFDPANLQTNSTISEKYEKFQFDYLYYFNIIDFEDGNDVLGIYNKIKSYNNDALEILFLSDFILSSNLSFYFEYNPYEINEILENKNINKLKMKIELRQFFLKKINRMKQILEALNEIDTLETRKKLEKELKHFRKFLNFQNDKFEELFLQTLKKIN